MGNLHIKPDGGIKISLDAPKKPLNSDYLKNKKRNLKKFKIQNHYDVDRPLEVKLSPISKETLELFGGLPDAFFKSLAASIVYRAALDYEEYLTELYFATSYQAKTTYYAEFRDVQRFFGSRWYYALVDVDHLKIVKYLNKKVSANLRKGKQIKSKGKNFASLK